MKVENTFKSLAIGQTWEARSVSVKTPPAPQSSAGIQDEVILTGGASLLRALESQLGKTDVTNLEKVASVREAIENGTYTIDEDAIAERLVNDIRDQLSRTRTPY